MRIEVNGLNLHVERNGQGAPLLLLHGFTGSTDTWAPFVPRFVRAGFSTIAVDSVGHGRSDAPAEPDRYRIERCVEDLSALLDHLGVGATAVLGYSMGGRVALQFAAAAPQRVSCLVLESASPGIADLAERGSRRQADEALADAIERDGVEAFVDRWERTPLLALADHVPPAQRARLRAQRLRHTATGLANSLRGMGAGRQEPLWDRLPRLGVPTLLVVGERDEKYRRLGAAMADALPDARLAVVPDAGHTVHVDQPERFAALALGFLRDRATAPPTNDTLPLPVGGASGRGATT